MINTTLKLAKISMLRMLFLGTLSVVGLRAHAQVNVNATGGTPTASYATLGDAFTAINGGIHQGAINVEISANTTEPGTAVLNSSGSAGLSNYTSVMIYPTADNVTVSGTSATGRGLIELKGADNVTIDGDNPLTTGTNRNLALVNTAANTVNYTSVIRIATATTVVTSADNIVIRNCKLTGSATGRNASGFTSTTGSENTTFGIYAGGNGGATDADAPTALTSVTSNTAASGTTINDLVVNNNTFTAMARALVLNGANASVCNVFTATNNVIGDQSAVTTYPYTSPATTVYTKGIYVAGATGVSITGNTIKNLLSYVQTTVGGIELNSAIGSGTLNIASNVIDGVVINASGGGICRGISVVSASGPYSIDQNTITRVEATSTSSSNRSSAIYVATSAASATITRNKLSQVRNFSTATWGVVGLFLNGGNNITVANNFVSDVNGNITGGTAFGFGFSIIGMYVGSGTGHKILHNTISMYGACLGSGSNISTSALAIGSTSNTGIDVRNNILSNTMTGGTTSIAHIALYLPSGGSSSMNLTLNNNAYYSGTDAARQGIAQAGTTAGTGFYLASNFVPSATTGATNLRTYTNTLSSAATNDLYSFGTTAAAPFISATDLHLVASATPSQLESGAAVTSITNDIDGQTRPGPAGSVNGGGINPDMGADEFDGAPLDIIAPLITYTALNGACTTGNRTLVATITDASGIPVSGSGLPVLYWKINGGAYTAAQGVSLGSNQYSFTFGNGVVVGDVVSYYVVAQDNATTPNVAVSPAAGATGFTSTPPAASTPPTTPSTYLIQNTLAGLFTVGASGNYATLTSAVNAYNTSCLAGPVIFELIDADYSTAETFPIVINNPLASSTNTLLIRPAAGVTASITGNASSIIKLNGADYVGINGSNNGTLTRDLTITNNSTSTTSLVVWIGSENASNPATNCGISNTNIFGNAPLTTFAGIFAGSGTTAGSAAEAANTNIVIANNAIMRCSYGIANAGVAAGSTGSIIAGNVIGSSTAADYVGFIGIFVSNQNGATITSNTISNIVTSANNPMGINVAANVLNTVISSNRIDNIRYTGTSGYGAKGLNINTNSTSSNLTVMNNMISNLGGDGWSSLNGDAIVGIRIGATGGSTTTTGGIQLYNNTVHLGSNTFAGNSSGTVSAALYLSSTATSIDARNNILTTGIVNSTASGAKTYALYSAAANTIFTAIDYNDYAVSGAQGVLAYIGSDRTDLAGIQAGFGANTHSVNIQPVYAGANDLHLVAASNPTLLDLGNVIATVTVDIDGQTRPATPDMGADEFGDLPATPSTPVQDPATPDCTSGTDLTVSGTPETNVTWYWQTAANGTSTSTPVAGPYNVTVNGTYYVRGYNSVLMVWSTNSSSVTVSNIPLAPLPPSPVADASPACGSANLSVPVSSDPNVSYYWQGTDANGTSNTMPASAPLNVTASNTYYVAAYDMSTNCWSNTSGVAVVVNPVPTGVVATASSLVICQGDSVDLSVNGAFNSIAAPGVALSETFDSGIGSWTIQNAGSSPAVANWSVKTPPYSYSTYFTNFSMPQGGNFLMAVSDAGGSGTTTDSRLISPVFSTVNFTSATLTFENLYRKWTSGDNTVKVEISTDGSTWTTLKNYLPLGSQGNNTAGAQVAAAESIVLPAAYLNQPTVQIRFNYIASFGYYWGVDNIQVAGMSQAPSTFAWTSVPAGFTSTDQNPMDVVPTGTTDYMVTVTNSYNCSSSAMVSVQVNQPSSSSLTASSCDSYTLNGTTYNASGTYTQVIQNVAGCDSTITLALTITNSTSQTLTPVVCSSYTAPSGAIFTTSGTYMDTIPNAAGCDSVLIIQLTVNTPTSSTVNVHSCDAVYTAPSGATYMTAGTYTDVIQNAGGCDSTITINLTFGMPTTSVITETVCDMYTTPSGTIHTLSGVYQDTLVNASGCDSVITINLTVNHSTSNSISEMACGSSYTSASGMVYTTSGTYTEVLQNAVGCDSLLTINLTLNALPNVTATLSNNVILTASGANSYQWINCATGAAIPGATGAMFTATQNGSYAVIGTNANGCADTSACVTVSTVGVKENDFQNLSLSPNPATSQVKLSYDFAGSVDVTVYDAQGKVVIARQSLSTGSVIGVAQLEPAVYFFAIDNGSETVVKRIVKE